MKKVPTKAGRPAASQSWVQQQPELFSSRAEIKREVSRALGAGLIRRLAPRLYTRNLVDAPETLIRRHVWDVIAALSPAGAVVSHRTAFEGQPSGSGDVWLTASYPRVIRVPGLTIHLVAGHRHSFKRRLGLSPPRHRAAEQHPKQRAFHGPGLYSKK